MSIILGMKLSITLKAKVKLLGWLWGTIAQWSEHLQLEQEALGWIPGGCPVFISLVAGLIMLMGWRICGTLVLYGCYQHRYEWKDLWCSSKVQLLSAYRIYSNRSHTSNTVLILIERKQKKIISNLVCAQFESEQFQEVNILPLIRCWIIIDLYNTALHDDK